MEKAVENAPDWDGKWWSESLTGGERAEYDALVARLVSAGRAEVPVVAREIFQMAFKLGEHLTYEGMRD